MEFVEKFSFKFTSLKTPTGWRRSSMKLQQGKVSNSGLQQMAMKRAKEMKLPSIE
jgi:hypothetical protein